MEVGALDVTSYEDLIEAADAAYTSGHYKDAHIRYGEAVSAGGPRNYYCRQMRGICSRHVAEERLKKAADQPDRRQPFLNQAARWLAKSEANLSSAFDESPELQLGHIRLEQAHTEETIARFMEMAGGNPARRLSAARTYREEGFERLGQA